MEEIIEQLTSLKEYLNKLNMENEKEIETLVSKNSELRDELEEHLEDSLKATMADALKNHNKTFKESEINKDIELKERFCGQELKLVELANDVTVLRKICDDTTAANEKLTDQVEALRIALAQARKALAVEKFQSHKTKQELKKVKFLLHKSKQELNKVKTE